MHRLHASRTWRFVALYVAATMVVPYAVIGFPVDAEAQAQPVVGSASVIVLPIQDLEGSVNSVLSQKATDALALAMEGSREYMVTSRMDLQRELSQLSLTPPLSKSEQVRLGNRLDVDEVASGQITRLRVDPNTGQVEIGLSVAMLNVNTGEHLNGANVATTTKVIPGWEGEEARVINDALREITAMAVSEILVGRITEGYVTSVNDFGVATLNIGHDDRLQPGMEMLLLRPVWQRDLEEMIMVRVGRYHVTEVSARSSKIVSLGDEIGRARVADRAFRLYRGPERMEAYHRKASHQQTITTAAAILALLGVVAVAGGSSTTDAPKAVQSHLYQQAPGDQAVIRVSVGQSTLPLRDQIFAWLFFRSDGQPVFSLMAQNLVGAVFEARLPGGIWDDSPEFQSYEVERDFTWIGPAGDEEDGSIELLFHAFALQPGHTYYHRVQRVVEPPARAGSGAPIATGQVSPAQVVLDDPELVVDPPSARAEGSKSTAGVTYFTPPVLQGPEDGSQNQSTSSITFTWQHTTGANEYILQVFPEDDPDGARAPRYQAQVRQDTSGTMFHTINDTFASSSRFYWRVGARRSGEALPENGRIGRGWLFSNIRTFTTAAAPPPPPGSNAAGVTSDGGRVQGGSFGQGRYLRQAPQAQSRGIR
ncbi:MAG: hypothetical protein ACOX9R_08810 [Armatimonadota bacterium]|jgi:hypothetical protein